MASTSPRLALGLALTMLVPSAAMATPEPERPPIQRPPNVAPPPSEVEAPSAEPPVDPPEPTDEGAASVTTPDGAEPAPDVPPEGGAVPPTEAPTGERPPSTVPPEDGAPSAEPIQPVQVRPAAGSNESAVPDEAPEPDDSLTVVGADGEPIELSPEPLPRRPFPGSGQITGGSVMIGLGVLTMATGIIILSVSQDYPPLTAGGTIILVLGIGAAGGGGGLVYEGVRNRKKYLAWRRQTGHDIPLPGNGMIVGGSVLAGVGLLTIPGRPGLAVGELVAGGVLMGVGIHLHTKWKRTLESHGLSLLPTYDRRLNTAGLALSGRF